MIKPILLTGLLLLNPVTLYAQTPTPTPALDVKLTYNLVWEHDGLNVTTFSLWIDDATLTLPPTTSYGMVNKRADGTFAAPLPTLTVGKHTLYMYAGNADAISSAVSLEVVVEERRILVPNPIGGMRIEVVVK